MKGSPSKVNPPNSHPSNPVHKAVMAVQGPKPAKKTPKRFNLPSDEVGQIKETFQETQQDKTDNHEINKTAAIVGVVTVAALLVLAAR